MKSSMCCVKFLAFATVLTISSCHPKTSESSKTSHAPGRFLNDDNPFQSTELDDERWVKHEAEGQPTYSARHPMTQRLQAWADAIRRNMLKSTPALSVAPRPIIRIVQSDKINAYVSTAPVCIDVRITTDPSVEQVADSPSHLMITEEGGVDMSTRPEDCTAIQGDITARLQAAQYAFRNIRGCKMSIDSERLALSPECLGGSSVSGNSFAGLSFNATHNYITVYSAVLKSASEPQIVGLLAHELGHYYMAHSMIKGEDYDYFYELKDKNSDSKPEPLAPDHPLSAVGERIRQLPPLYFPKIEGQEFHSALYKVVGNMSYNIRDNQSTYVCREDKPDCMTTCSMFGKLVRTDYGGLLSYLPYDFLHTDAAKDAYRQYEAGVKSCLPLLKASFFEASVRSSLSNLIYEQPIAPPALRDKENALELIQDVDKIIKEKVGGIESAKVLVVREAQEKGLGWYTAEQEADDIGTEMVYRVGLDPMSFVEFTVNSAEAQGNTERRKQYEAGFPTPVSLENFDDLHHDYCFRAYNIFQEIEVHKDYFAKYSESTIPVIQPELTWNAALDTLMHIE
ncbi:MAG TPA: M48 family metalloprotease [Oligoflexus sp.]|uniref:M48 family metalloprotease n=1 Tax=Oligoflexus sp. TaxID=1971216 RepID=UPI002D5C78B6|nr:M48 family metalloprotease [Oligoflexus sp.]HYX32879.1 M48 family metalloprotease [Oligoflexus sp.]